MSLRRAIFAGLLLAACLAVGPTTDPTTVPLNVALNKVLSKAHAEGRKQIDPNLNSIVLAEKVAARNKATSDELNKLIGQHVEVWLQVEDVAAKGDTFVMYAHAPSSVGRRLSLADINEIGRQKQRPGKESAEAKSAIARIYSDADRRIPTNTFEYVSSRPEVRTWKRGQSVRFTCVIAQMEFSETDQLSAEPFTKRVDHRNRELPDDVDGHGTFLPFRVEDRSEITYAFWFKLIDP